MQDTKFTPKQARAIRFKAKLEKLWNEAYRLEKNGIFNTAVLAGLEDAISAISNGITVAEGT